MRTHVTILLLALASPACAGKSVPVRLVEALPSEVFSATADLDAAIAQLTEARTAKREAVARAKGDVKALKLEVKAAKARAKADRAEWKAARKRGDSEAAAAAREAQEASEARATALQARLTAQDALVDLLEAQLDLIETQLAFKEAEREVVLAQAVDAHVEPYDDAPLRAARAKAELKYQRARADVGQAERRYTAAGGTEVPPAGTIPDPAPAAPAPE